MPRIDVNISQLGYEAIADEHISVEDFIQGVVDQVVKSRQEVLIKRRTAAMRSDPAIEMMPASDDGMLRSYFDADGYENADTKHENMLEAKRLKEEALEAQRLKDIKENESEPT